MSTLSKHNIEEKLQAFECGLNAVVFRVHVHLVKRRLTGYDIAIKRKKNMC